jgi:hypothetical protein
MIILFEKSLERNENDIKYISNQSQLSVISDYLFGFNQNLKAIIYKIKNRSDRMTQKLKAKYDDLTMHDLFEGEK